MGLGLVEEVACVPVRPVDHFVDLRLLKREVAASNRRATLESLYRTLSQGSRAEDPVEAQFVRANTPSYCQFV